VIFVEKNISEVWTSGAVDRNLTACEGNLTINWCQSSNSSLPSWWNGKFEGMDENATSKAISLRNTNLRAADEKTELPFVCKVSLV